MSGYPAVGAATELMGVARPLICKPFTQAQLAAALAQVLADPSCDEVFGAWSQR